MWQGLASHTFVAAQDVQVLLGTLGSRTDILEQLEVSLARNPRQYQIANAESKALYASGEYPSA